MSDTNLTTEEILTWVKQAEKSTQLSDSIMSSIRPRLVSNEDGTDIAVIISMRSPDTDLNCLSKKILDESNKSCIDHHQFELVVSIGSNLLPQVIRMIQEVSGSCVASVKDSHMLTQEIGFDRSLKY